MPNFRLSDAADSGDLGIHLAVGAHRSPAHAEAGQCGPRQGAVRDPRLSGLPLHRRRRSDAGRDLRREPDPRRRKGQLRLPGALDSQRPRSAPVPTARTRRKTSARKITLRRACPTSSILQHSRCPNDGHELQVQNMTVMPSLRLSLEDAQDIATYPDHAEEAGPVRLCRRLLHGRSQPEGRRQEVGAPLRLRRMP